MAAGQRHGHWALGSERVALYSLVLYILISIVVVTVCFLCCSVKLPLS